MSYSVTVAQTDGVHVQAQRFNEKDKQKHARYYWGIAHALKELEDHLYFKEYVMLCRTVFGEDVISSNKDMMQGEYE